MKSYLAVAGLCACLAACGSQPKQSGAAATPAPAAEPAKPDASHPAKYDLKGKVVAVDKAGKRLTVNNEDIPGFMSAMTMAYPVKDEHLLDNLNAGDPITAKVVSTGSEFWLEDIAVAK
jgi:Cu/Ag efflux protein CusF